MEILEYIEVKYVEQKVFKCIRYAFKYIWYVFKYIRYAFR